MLTCWQVGCSNRRAIVYPCFSVSLVHEGSREIQMGGPKCLGEMARQACHIRGDKARSRTILETGNRAEQERFSELGDIDLLEAGLVLIDDVGIQITDAGLSLLRSLKSSAARSPAASSSSASYQFKLLDSQIGTEDRLKIFDLEMRRLELRQRRGGRVDEDRHVDVEDDHIVERPEEITPNFSGRRTCRSTSVRQDRANRARSN